LPLAHEQAAAYCARTGLSLSDYRKKFEAEPTKFLEKDASPRYHNRRTAAKTFLLAIEEAAKLHPAAESLITYVALLAPEPIPLYLFSEARETFAEPFASQIGEEGLDEAVAALRAFALVDRESIPDERDQSTTTDCIRLHRLVREVAAARCEEHQHSDIRRDLLLGMAEIFPDDVYSNPQGWPRARRLDAIAIELLKDDLDVPQGAKDAASLLLNGLATYRLEVLAAYAEARLLYERALAIDETEFGLEHVRTGQTLHNLGHVVLRQGNLEEARPLLERALAICEKARGPDHPETVPELGNLGYLLRRQGDIAGARFLFERALKICEKAFGPNDTMTATTLQHLGGLLADQDDLAEARQYLERGLNIYEETLGPDHPFIARSLNNLARLLWNQGDHAGACSHFERALAIWDKALGRDHPDTKFGAGVAAMALEALGFAEKAQAVRKRFKLKGAE
jgi:tetratricopeptide (TPR) repeat protein